ncbi:MAG: RecX family transcriptional regulator, partial [Pseudomonadota bacterium]
MPRRKDEENEQPGIPAREARLLDVNHRDNSVILILDDGSSLELAEESVPPGLPETGEMLSVELLAELRLAAERKQVARMIFAMLDRRLQPLARIRDKAAEKGYSVAAVDAVLEQMASRGLYSDRRYAEAYCRDCLATKAVGRRYLIGRNRDCVSRLVGGQRIHGRIERDGGLVATAFDELSRLTPPTHAFVHVVVIQEIDMPVQQARRKIRIGIAKTHSQDAFVPHARTQPLVEHVAREVDVVGLVSLDEIELIDRVRSEQQYVRNTAILITKMYDSHGNS